MASSMVSAEFGGTVSNGRVTLQFPPGALDTDTEISIELLTDGTLGVELSPHGIQFNKPVVMSMDLRGTTAEGMSEQTSTYYWNELKGYYELQEKVDGADPNANASAIYHFSKFNSGVGG
jgi:hypothetical protein